MKKSFLLIVLVAQVVYGMNGDAKTYAVRNKEAGSIQRAKAKQVDIVKVVPHLAVNSEWVSTLTIRSDSGNQIYLLMEFYNEFGDPVPVTFYDSNDQVYSGEFGFIIPDLGPSEIYSLDFDSLDDGSRNLQVFVYSDEFDSNYGLEAVYNRFSGSSKIASVGVKVEAPDYFFVMNVDQRVDPYSLNRKFRGMAVTNVGESDCNCEVTVYDDLGYPIDESGASILNPGAIYPILSVDIPGSGKWVGTTYDLFSDIDTLLPREFGYFFFDCTNPVSVLGLAFEENTPIVASVPIDYFTVNDTKNGRIRIKRE